MKVNNANENMENKGSGVHIVNVSVSESLREEESKVQEELQRIKDEIRQKEELISQLKKMNRDLD